MKRAGANDRLALILPPPLQDLTHFLHVLLLLSLVPPTILHPCQTHCNLLSVYPILLCYCASLSSNISSCGNWLYVAGVLISVLPSGASKYLITPFLPFLSTLIFILYPPVSSKASALLFLFSSWPVLRPRMAARRETA